MSYLERALQGIPRRPLGVLLLTLLAFNLLSWLAAFGLAAIQPGILALAGLAWVFGARHAFDVDHIAAIDNVTRKLRQEGKRPVAVGFFFALGHSTIVVALSAVVALGAR
ncbi:HoxN/HupN/NixA family nickel/cobalt transporter, partial [Acidihalobacter prosperus]